MNCDVLRDSKPCEALLNQDQHDQMKISGYRRSNSRFLLCWMCICLTGGLLRLVLHWWRHWYLLATCQPCPLQEAQQVLVEEDYQGKHKVYHVKPVQLLTTDQLQNLLPEESEIDGDKLQLSVHFTSAHFKNCRTLRTFRCKQLVYAWDNGIHNFNKINGLDVNVPCSYFHQQRGLTLQEQLSRRIVFGVNEITVPLRDVKTLLFLEILNPFYVFQIFSVVLWFTYDYYYYACVILLMSIFGISMSIIQTKKNQDVLHQTVLNTGNALVVNAKGVSTELPTSTLVPGDIIEIPSSGCTMHCDAVLLSGNCILDESMLTGESVPVTKTPLPMKRDVIFDKKEHARHTLFSGTKVIQTRYIGSKKVLAFVINTGNITAKGGLIRSILYPPPVDYKFEQDSYKFIQCLALIACIGFIYTLVTKFFDDAVIFSLEVLGPNQYTRMLGNNGQTSLYLTREDSSISPAGVTELTRYLLHDTPTTTVTFTPTTIRGRKTSFSHVLPSTVYSVENVVSTVQPQISANAPLANILLSQLLLGNINLPANQLLGALGQPQPQLGQEPSLPAAPAQPQTEYRTHTSTYVTTIYDGKSTILPITFQGKKILTTVFDTTAQTITATEYSVDTIISTPTQQPQLQPQGVQGQGQVNSLLLQQLLLQQQQQQQLQPIPQVLPTTMPQIFLGENLQDLDNPLMDADNNNIDDIIVSDIDADHSVHKSSGRKKSRKSGKSHKRNKQQQQQPKQEEEESSVITLYVSGRRPGEFSTILSTVYPQEQSSSLHKRQVQQQTTATAELHGPEDLYEFGASEKMSSYSYLPLDECQGSNCELKSPTASLESIIGDVDLWYAKATKQASRPPMSFSSTASSASASAQMITAESDNLQVTNLSTTHPPSTMPRLRKVLVRRKPISGYPTLVNDNTNTNTMKLSGQPKKHRVVIFKYRSARRMKSSTAETFKTSESTTLPTLQPTLQPSMDQNQQRFYLLTTSSTELSTRTYTYVVERVHNDQHETLQSYSTFTRVNTRIVPITLTVETAVVSTQIHS
ncbi:hypothetical protein ACLKA6_001479 [Drosophila palustris]